MGIIYFVIAFVTALTAGLLGSTRRIGFWLTFFLSFLITPIGAAVLAILTGPRLRSRQKVKP